MARLPPVPPHRPLPAPERARSEIRDLPAGSRLVRIYVAGGQHPGAWNLFRTWGPTGARFDHQAPPPHDDPLRALLYAAGSLWTAVAEVFQATGVIDTVANAPYLAVLATVRPLALLDLASNWPTRAGASQALGTAPEHEPCRAWSRAIWEDLPDLDGIAWPSAMDAGGVAYALYERARDALAPDPALNLPLSIRGLAVPLAHAADRLGYGLVLR